MKFTTVPVILAGGSGTRLWPSSRSEYPKQFLSLTSGHSLFQDTLLRIPKAIKADPIVVVHEAYASRIKDHADACKRTVSIIAENKPRGTAVAIALAAHYAMQHAATGSIPILCVMPADHVIQDTKAFGRALAQAAHEAESGGIITFGIIPTYPETGYGYIHAGTHTSEHVRKVAAFVEKPNTERAEQYVLGGEHFWNSGMFVARADELLREIALHAPSVHAWTARVLPQKHSVIVPLKRVDDEPVIGSIDTLVMEKTNRAKVIPVSMGWNDIGSWSALHDTSIKDGQGNVLVGDVVIRDVSNSYIRSESRLVTVIGLSHVVVVETPEALLVLDKSKAQDVNKLVATLKEARRPEALRHAHMSSGVQRKKKASRKRRK
ncbi:MAG: mannose-phosphate guanylyltransferase [Candidatus Parcubacteria bacterium]|jgi:mannose-1-phosphate guanylyltransferase/mannose-6-phosphate isomerase